MSDARQKGQEPSGHLSSGQGFVNGRFVPLEEASIPLLDWGFNKSDVVYDGIPFAAGRIFRLGDHLERFDDSMHKWRLPRPYPLETIADICHDLVARSGLRDGILYVCTTRGMPPSAEIRDPSRFRSRMYGWSQQVPQLGTPEQLRQGLSMTVSTVPRIPETSVDATAKNFHWGDLIQARLEAGDRGAQNAILLNHEGDVAEGVGFNVFAAINGELRTPNKDCLLGITRRTALEIAADQQIPCSESTISAAELVNSSEVFITSSAGGVFAVTRIDDVEIGDGRMGQITQQVRDEYWKRRVSPEWTVEVDYDNTRCGDSVGASSE